MFLRLLGSRPSHALSSPSHALMPLLTLHHPSQSKPPCPNKLAKQHISQTANKLWYWYKAVANVCATIGQPSTLFSKSVNWKDFESQQWVLSSFFSVISLNLWGVWYWVPTTVWMRLKKKDKKRKMRHLHFQVGFHHRGRFTFWRKLYWRHP